MFSSPPAAAAAATAVTADTATADTAASAGLAARAHKEYAYMLLQLLGQFEVDMADGTNGERSLIREGMGFWPGIDGAAALALQVVSTAADGGALLSALSFRGTLLPLQPCPLKPADTAKMVALLQKLLPRTVEDVTAVTDAGEDVTAVTDAGEDVTAVTDAGEDVTAVTDAGEHDMCSALYWTLRQLIAAQHKDVSALLRGRAEVLSLLPSAANTSPRSLTSLYAGALFFFFSANYYSGQDKAVVAAEIEHAAKAIAASSDLPLAARLLVTTISRHKFTSDAELHA